MSKPEQKITLEILKEMIAPDELSLITNNVFCRNCQHTTIVGFENDISVNDLGDTILRGKCKKCGSPVARYIETGEMAKH